MQRLSRLIFAPPSGLILALVLFVGACASAPGAIARGAPESFAPLVKKVLPAVVNIAVTQTLSGADIFNDLPPELRDANPTGRLWRSIDGVWTQADVPAA